MPHQRLIWLLLLVLAAGTTTVPEARAGSHDSYSVAPAKRPDGRAWRLAYLEGGNYNDYIPVLKNTLENLARMGWLEIPACLPEAGTSREAWSCLATVESPFLRFLPDAFWTADWDAETRKANRQAFLDRARDPADVDLVLAMGTWAGQDLANDEHHVPTVVMSTSNAIQSGIIKSAEDSGRDHVHARVDPQRYARQVRLFHDIVGFKILGLVYEDSVEGRSYAGLDAVERVARERGFSIDSCIAPFSKVDQKTADQLVVQCHEELAPRVDGLYITIHRGVNPANMPRLLAPLFAHNTPNFAMGTLYEVRQGALMSMAQPNLDHLNRFWAETIAKILNGATPRKLNQILEDPQKIAINLKAAELIGFDFPLSILGAAERIHETIEPAPGS